jgi:prolipoprotein diacylglyceryltransferase
LRFAAPLAAAIAVGRIGRYFSGIADRTDGTPTNLPWGHDFGGGVLRHPVQIYESLAMVLFLVAFLVLLRLRSRRYRVRSTSSTSFAPGCWAMLGYLAAGSCGMARLRLGLMARSFG